MRISLLIVFLLQTAFSGLYGQYTKTAKDIEARYKYIFDLYCIPRLTDNALRDSMQRHYCKKVITIHTEPGAPQYKTKQFFNHNGNLTKEKNYFDLKLSSNSRFEYAADGKLKVEVRFTKNKITYLDSITYNENGQISQIINHTDFGGDRKTISSFGYDDKGRLIKKTETTGIRETNITAAIQNYNSITTTIIHYSGSKPDSIITFRNNPQQERYDTVFRFFARYDSKNQITEARQYNKHTSIALTPNGPEPGMMSHEKFNYTAGGKLLRSYQKVPARETDTTFYFDENGTLEKITADWKGYPSATMYYRVSKDSLSDTLYTVLDTSQLVFPNLKMQLRTFSPNGKLLTETMAKGSRSMMNIEQITEWQYDFKGRIAGVRNYSVDWSTQKMVKSKELSYVYNYRGQEILYTWRDRRNNLIAQTSRRFRYY